MITITDNIRWEDGAANLEARQWINEHVMSQEGDKDRYGRPYKWMAETPTACVIVVREYVRPGTWAKKRDVITVTGKEVADETV